MQPHRLSYAATHRFSPVVLDHLAGDPLVRDLIPRSPDLAGLRAAASERVFDPAARAVLCDALERQYEGVEVGDAVRANLTLLRRPDALTVTTGHQCCLFTGPLYVPFKALNTIRLARTLTTDLGRPVVPVFWMASEDHDRAEIDHAWLNGEKVEWPGSPGGPVGRMRLEGIGTAVAQAMEALGQAPHADALRELLRACYAPERGLADATRRLFHALFGRLGLVVLDGDDPALKRLFAPHLRRELLEGIARPAVERANAKLEGRYPAQVHARDINLFHLRPGHRARIALEDGRYHVHEGGPGSTREEAAAAVEERPEDFSPNVVLRPVYQEVVLPNIAYIGGGGELAYWAQLRGVFEAFGAPMPVVLLRTSAAFLSAKQSGQWAAAGLAVEDLFAPLDALKARVAAGMASFPTDTGTEHERLNALYDGLLERAKAADPTLAGTVEAMRKKALDGLDRIGQGLVRAAKREQETALQRLDRVHEALFPDGGLQERRDNILPLLALHGTGFLDDLLESLDPLDPRFTLLVQ